MTTQTPIAEPVCPGAVGGSERTETASTPNPQPIAQAAVQAAYVAVHRPFTSISQVTWDGLLARNPWATPFSSWAFQRAWWDAYGANAHDETVVILPADSSGAPLAAAEPIGIVPLMHRHEVEPSDLDEHTRMRQSTAVELTSVPGSATAIFFGGSYHADYATLLAAPDDFDRVSDALAAHLSAARRAGLGCDRPAPPPLW